MERFRIDGEALRRHYQTDVSLRQVFADIERELHLEKRVVCKYIVNGLSLEEHDEIRFAEISLSEIQTLEYLSERTEFLAVEVLQGWIQSIPELTAHADRLARGLRSLQGVGVQKPFHDWVQNCEFLVESVISLRSLLGDRALATQTQWDEAERLTQRSVSQALRYMENKEFVLLADLIEYDLCQSLDLWRRVLQGVLDTLTGGENRGGRDGDRKNQAQQPHSVGGDRKAH